MAGGLASDSLRDRLTVAVEVQQMTMQQRAEEFFRALGVAITDWAHIDSELFEICAEILGTNLRQAAIVYYRTPSIEARLSLTIDLVETLFPTPNPGDHPNELQKAWSKLCKDLREELPVRNQLAHAPVTPRLKSEKLNELSGVIDFEYWYASGKSRNERLRGRENDERLLTVDDVHEHMKQVSHLYKRVRDARAVFQRVVAGNIKDFGSSAAPRP